MDTWDRFLNRLTLGVGAVLLVVAVVSGVLLMPPLIERRWHDATLPGATAVIMVGLGFALQRLRDRLGLPDPHFRRPAPDWE